MKSQNKTRNFQKLNCTQGDLPSFELSTILFVFPLIHFIYFSLGSCVVVSFLDIVTLFSDFCVCHFEMSVGNQLNAQLNKHRLRHKLSQLLYIEEKHTDNNDSSINISFPIFFIMLYLFLVVAVCVSTNCCRCRNSIQF